MTEKLEAETDIEYRADYRLSKCRAVTKHIHRARSAYQRWPQLRRNAAPGLVSKRDDLSPQRAARQACRKSRAAQLISPPG